MILEPNQIVSLLAWGVCLGWAAYRRRWRMTCAFGCLAAAAVLHKPSGPDSDKVIMVALTVFALMLLLSDVRAHTRKQRSHDDSAR